MKHPLLILFCLCLVSCTSHDQHSGKTVFRYNEAANISTLDPAFARDQSIIWISNQLFNGLVQLDDHLEVKPCIAHSWEISTSGLEYTFHLRQDVSFHPSEAFKNGGSRMVNARDFVYSFRRILDPAVASPGAWVFNNLNKAGNNIPFHALNDSTLVIRLSQPFPPFLGLLSMPYCSVIPHEAIEFFGTDFRRNPVGTGPFRFKMWEEGVKLILVKNSSYFETEGSNKLPYLDAISVTFIPDKQTVFLNFVKGNLDFMSGIDATYKDELLTKEGTLQSKYQSTINLITQPYLNTEYLGFLMTFSNDSKVRALADKRVRQAINFAIDREKMIRYLRNNIGTPGEYGITPKGLPSFDPSRKFYYYDPVKAGKLLQEAGYPNGKGLPVIRLTTTSDYLDICKYIQHQVSTLGIDLQIEVSTPAALKEMKAEAKLPFFRASWIADYPDAENYLSMFWTQNYCPKGPNYTHFSFTAFDRLYEKSMSTVNDTTRYRFYREMEVLLMSEAPVIVLYYDEVLRFTQKNIHGLGVNPMNLLTLKRVKKL